MKLFLNDEVGYLDWVKDHPDGWVANADKAKLITNYPMVHRASHALLSSPTKGNYTSGPYLKACSTDVAELQAWSQAEFGKPLTWCETCTKADAKSPAVSTDQDAWSDGELRASVAAYLDMRSKTQSGTPYVKKRVYEALAAKFGRTSKAFEYRMQNISYIFELLGRSWIPGLLPARNVGAATGARIEAFIAELEGSSHPPKAAFEIEVSKAKKSLTAPPAGTKQPKASTAAVTTYARDPAVKAWVLREAKGVCECCQQPAPFHTAEGPFLEVHHVRLLADQGSDTVCNAVAICPNCHRALHYALNAKVLVEALYAKVARLKPPTPQELDLSATACASSGS